MNRFPIFVAIVLALALAGCGSSISVTSDYDPATDFAKLKTFRWLDIKRGSDDPLGDQLVKNRVKSATYKALVLKGFVQKETGEPDFWVAAHAGAKEKMNVTNWGGHGYGYGYGPYWGGGMYGGNNIDVSYYTEASLVIDIAVNQGENDQLAWRGIGTGTLSKSQKSPEESQADLDEVVSLILEEFPPKK
jgi:hypothetical protein